MNPAKLNRIFNILGNAFLEMAKEFKECEIQHCPELTKPKTEAELDSFVNSLFDYNLPQTQQVELSDLELTQILNPPLPPSPPKKSIEPPPMEPVKEPVKVVEPVKAKTPPPERVLSSDSLVFQTLKQKDLADKKTRTELIETKVKAIFTKPVEVEPTTPELKKKSKESSKSNSKEEQTTEKKETDVEAVSSDEVVHIPKILRKYLKKFEIPYREFEFTLSDQSYRFEGEKTREHKNKLLQAGFKWNPNIRAWTIVKTFVDKKMSST